MHTAGFIDMVITDWLGLSLTDTYVTSEWRPKVLRKTQQVVQEIWDYAEWPFKPGIALAQSIAGNTSFLLLPVDFIKAGVKGGIFIPGTKREIPYLPPDALKRRRLQGWTGTPDYYTVEGQDPTTLRLMALFDRAPTEALLVDIYYEKQAPTLVDNTLVSNKLDNIPADFHLDVIYPGVCDLLALGEGDGRAISELSPRFKEALGRKAARQQQGEDGFAQYGDHGVPELGMW